MRYPCHCVYSRVLVATVNERNLSVSRVKIKVLYCTVLYCTVLYCTVLSVLPLQRGQQVPGSWTWCMQGSLGHSWDTQRTSPSWKESQGLAYRPLVML